MNKNEIIILAIILRRRRSISGPAQEARLKSKASRKEEIEKKGTKKLVLKLLMVLPILDGPLYVRPDVHANSTYVSSK